jgi:hypothetical protein
MMTRLPTRIWLPTLRSPDCCPSSGPFPARNCDALRLLRRLIPTGGGNDPPRRRQPPRRHPRAQSCCIQVLAKSQPVYVAFEASQVSEALPRRTRRCTEDTEKKRWRFARCMIEHKREAPKCCLLRVLSSTSSVVKPYLLSQNPVGSVPTLALGRAIEHDPQRRCPAKQAGSLRNRTR